MRILLVRDEFLDHKSKGRDVEGQIVEGQIVVASRNEEGRFNLLGHKKRIFASNYQQKVRLSFTRISEKDILLKKSHFLFNFNSIGDFFLTGSWNLIFRFRR